MNPEHLAPMAMIIEIEPAELTILEDCEVSLDALNFLGKRMDGMSKGERNQFLAVLSSDETGIGCSLNLSGISTEGYALFITAKAIYRGGVDISLHELCDADLIDDSTVMTIFAGVMLFRNGIGLLNWRV